MVNFFFEDVFVAKNVKEEGEIENEKERRKFENMIHGRFIFNELYPRLRDNFYEKKNKIDNYK